MSRTLKTLTLYFALVAAGPLVGSADACPSCKIANATKSKLPTAYMYSILFMLAVPASVATSFGIGFYRLSKKQQDDEAEIEAWYDSWCTDDLADPSDDSRR